MNEPGCPEQRNRPKKAGLRLRRQQRRGRTESGRELSGRMHGRKRSAEKQEFAFSNENICYKVLKKKKISSTIIVLNNMLRSASNFMFHVRS